MIDNLLFPTYIRCIEITVSTRLKDVLLKRIITEDTVLIITPIARALLLQENFAIVN